MQLTFDCNETELPIVLEFIQEMIMPVELNRIVAIETEVQALRTDVTALQEAVAAQPGLVEEVDALEVRVNDLSTALGAVETAPTPPIPPAIRAARR